ncbi:MAG: T9SS type A sorting domain-containing protein [Leptolyngbya sp. SIO3F4]|nr:T9SS type A sorting domain-containing protein [Leptolyngbya sp. SIO3F4]
MLKIGTLAVTLLLSLPGIAQLTLTDSLVAFYPFTGNASDDSGNGHNANVNGPVLTADRFGNANYAYYFDGIDDQMVIADHPDLDVTTDVTVSAWIKPDVGFGSFVNGVIQIVSKWGANGAGNAAYLLGIRENTEKLAPWTYNGTQGTYAISSATIPADQWSFVAMTITNQEMRVYFNGALDTLFMSIRIPQNSNYDLRFGTEASGLLNSYYAGVLDEVRIYKRALSGMEIESLYNESNPVTSVAQVENPTESIRVYPNPARETLNIQCACTWKSATLIDVQGKQVMHTTQTNTLPVSELHNGLYFLVLETEAGVQETWKVIVQH